MHSPVGLQSPQILGPWKQTCFDAMLVFHSSVKCCKFLHQKGGMQDWNLTVQLPVLISLYETEVDINLILATEGTHV